MASGNRASLQIMIDQSKADLLKTFSKAFNSNDIAGTKACVTDQFRWVYYEGSESPYGRIFKGVEAACGAVVDRAERLSGAISFDDAEEFQAGDKVIVTYRASGTFHDTGPFNVRAVDIYTFEADRLAEKDTYWKIIRPD